MQTRNTLIIPTLLLSAPLFAATPTADQLKQIKRQVSSAQQEVTALASQRQQLYLRLRQIEVKYGHLKNTYGKTQDKIKNLQAQVDILKQKQHDLSGKLQSQYQIFGKQLQASYQLGREPLLKLILSGEDPSTINRQQAYLANISQGQAQFIKQIQKTQNQLNDTEQDLDNQTEELQALSEQQKQRLVPISQTMNQRNQAVAVLDASLQTKQQQLQQLLANQRQLANTLAAIRAKQSYAAFKHQDFNKLKGHLPWPVHGNVILRYKAPMASDKIRSDGILISAPEGTPIHAIAPGRVAFSSWMPGYGIVIIVEHSHGFMSIYGHNQAVFKQVGEMVSPGDVIATVGRTGGRHQPGLYFELRRKTEPLNPTQWLAHSTH